MKNSSAYIGVFDSGAGGLTVVRHIMEMMPDENILYFGDTAHLPYGTKSERQIKEYSTNNVAFLNGFELKSLVIACNTADSVARQTLIKEFDLPIYGVIDPASKKAAETSQSGRIGIMATKATVRSDAYRKAILRYRKDAEVFQLACPLLVPLVETQRYKKDDPLVRIALGEYLDELRQHNVDTIVLGCTHYPLLMDAVSSMAPDIRIISSSKEAAQALCDSLTATGQLNSQPGSIRRYYVSDDAAAFRDNAHVFIGEDLDEVIQVAV